MRSSPLAKDLGPPKETFSEMSGDIAITCSYFGSEVKNASNTNWCVHLEF